MRVAGRGRFLVILLLLFLLLNGDQFFGKFFRLGLVIECQYGFVDFPLDGRVVRFFDMPNEVIFAAEALRTELAEEVALAGVHDQMSRDVLAGHKIALADVAAEFAISRRFQHTTARMPAQMQEKIFDRFVFDAAEETVEIAVLRAVPRLMLLLRHGRAVLLLAVGPLAAKDHLARIMYLVMVLEVVVAEEASLADRAEELAVLGMDKKMPDQFELGREGLVAVFASKRPFPRVRKHMAVELAIAAERFRTKWTGMAGLDRGPRRLRAPHRLHWCALQSHSLTRLFIIIIAN